MDTIHFPEHINLHIHQDKSEMQEILKTLKTIVKNQHLIIKNQKHMAQELEDLKAAVAKDTEVDQSAITLLNGLKQKLDDAIASGDPEALKALSDQLGTNAQALADAVTANTPAA